MFIKIHLIFPRLRFVCFVIQRYKKVFQLSISYVNKKTGSNGLISIYEKYN